MPWLLLLGEDDGHGPPDHGPVGVLGAAAAAVFVMSCARLLEVGFAQHPVRQGDQGQPIPNVGVGVVAAATRRERRPTRPLTRCCKSSTSTTPAGPALSSACGTHHRRTERSTTYGVDDGGGTVEDEVPAADEAGLVGHEDIRLMRTTWSSPAAMTWSIAPKSMSMTGLVGSSTNCAVVGVLGAVSPITVWARSQG